MRRGAVRAWAVMGVLFIGGLAASDPLPGNVETLAENKDGPDTARRMLCDSVSHVCAWHLTQSMGGCSGDDCSHHFLVLTNGYFQKLGASSELEANAVPRFPGNRQLELISSVSLIEKNPGGRPRDAGIPPILLRRQLLTFSADGSKFEDESGPDWISPERKEQLQKLLALPGESGPPAPPAPVSEALRAQAQKACGVPEPLAVTHYECRKGAGSCVLVLGGKSGDQEQPLCVVQIKGKEVRALPIQKLVPQADEFSLLASAYCFVFSTGGYYGQSGDEQCISRERPGHMAFVETKGVHLESAEGYPVRKAASVAEGFQLAPTVHAFTVAQLRWGKRNAESWRDEKDLSLSWQAVRVGEALHFHVEVTDDVFLPLGEGRAVRSDHLELTLWQSREAVFKKKGPHLQLAVLLAGEGQAQVRLWERFKDGKDRNVDEAYSAKGTWTRTPGGYTVDLALPVEPLRKELAASQPWGLELMASDADDQEGQKALLGTRGAFPLWDDYPPTIEEYVRAFPRN